MVKPSKLPPDAPPVLTEWCAFRAHPSPVPSSAFTTLFREVTDRKGHRLILEGVANRALVLDRLQDLYARTISTHWGGYMPAPDECLPRGAVADLIRAEVKDQVARLRQLGHDMLADTLAQVPIQFIDPYSFDSLPDDDETLADAILAVDRPHFPLTDPVHHVLVRAFLHGFERGPARHVLGPVFGDTADHSRSYQLYLSGYYYALDWDGIMVACVHDCDLPVFMHPPTRGASR